MDDYAYNDDFFELYSDLNVPSLVKLLAEKFASNARCVDYDLAQKLNVEAWEILLKKRSVEPIKFNEVFEEDIFSSVLWYLKDTEDSESIVNKINSLIEISSSGNQWINDILKLLLVFHLSGVKINEETNYENLFQQDFWNDIINEESSSSLFKVASRPRYFALNSSEELEYQIVFDKPLRGLLKNSKSWPVDSDTSSLDDIESSVSPYSINNNDEGFFTPGDEVVSCIGESKQTSYDTPTEFNDLIPFDGINLSEISFHSGDDDFYLTHPIYEKEQSFVCYNKHLAMKDQPSFISQYQLFLDIKALCLGVSSHSFSKVNNKFVIKKNLCTDLLCPNALKEVCQLFMTIGENFIQLEEISRKLSYSKSVIVAAMKPCFNKYCYKFQTVIAKLPYNDNLSVIQKQTAYLNDELAFLISCFNKHSNGVTLLNRLYDCLLSLSQSSYIFHLASILFLSCCKAYFNLLDKWIYFGKSHPDLFVKQNNLVSDVSNREEFLKSFTFISEKVPKFLPALRIYNCGHHLVLLNWCSKGDVFPHKGICRPKIKLCTDYCSLKKLERHCKIFYEECSSRLPNSNHMYSMPLIDFVKMEETKQLRDAKILKDAKENDEKLFHQKQISSLTLQKDMLHHQLHDRFLKFREIVNSVRYVREQINAARELEQSRATMYRNDLAEHYAKLMAESSSTKRYLEWKMKRLSLSEKRHEFFETHYNLSNDCYTSASYDKGTQTSISVFHPKSAIRDQNSVNIHQSINFCNDLNISEDEDKDNGDTVVNDPKECLISCSTTYKTVSTSIESDSSLNINTDSKCTMTEDNDLHNEKYYEVVHSSDADIINSSSIADNYFSCDSQADISSESASEDHLHDENDCEDLSKNDLKEYTYLDQFKLEFQSLEMEDTASLTDYDDLNLNVLPDLIYKSVIIPLEVCEKLIGTSLVRIFAVENNLYYHLWTIRNYFFFCDGIYGEKLCSELFTAIIEQEPSQLLISTNLNNILQKACGNTVNELSFDVTQVPVMFEDINPQVLSCVNLVYKPEWPLNLIITETAVSKYATVFQLVLSIERAAWHLKKLFFLLRIKSVDLHNSHQYRQIQLHWHVMFQFINALKFYVNVVVFETNWAKLVKKLTSIDSVEEIYKSHSMYIKDIRFKCFLNESSKQIMKHLIKLLRCILQYCHYYQFGEINIAPSGSFKHQKFDQLAFTFNNFVKIANYFTYVIQSCAQNEQQSHFKILLELLNFLNVDSSS